MLLAQGCLLTGSLRLLGIEPEPFNCESTTPTHETILLLLRRLPSVFRIVLALTNLAKVSVDNASSDYFSLEKSESLGKYLMRSPVCVCVCVCVRVCPV